MSFQLFPPPPRKQRPINLKRPAQPASPEPAVELLERAKAPVDFHELVIKVNSNPASPIETPPQAHVGSSTAGKSLPKPSATGTGKNVLRSDSPQSRARSSSLRSGNGRTTPSSGGHTSHSPNNISPSRESEDTISPLSQADRQFYTSSPAFSDATTLVRNQSTATHRTKLSQTSPKDAPVMRSIFPRYNPDLPLSHQQYKPTQTSPADIPKDKISRKPYSPTFYVPHANVLRSGSPEEPYYTPKIELGTLWDAANGKARPEGWRTYALQMHRRNASPTSSPVDGEAFVFGASPVQPFYSFEQALIDKDTDACEVLISRTNPTQPRDNNNPHHHHSLPIAHLAIQTPPPHGHAPPRESHPEATAITTITPKLATLGALEAAAQSARASEIASFDPRAESPAAAALAADAVAACEAQHACALRYCPVAEPLMAPYEAGKTGTYELRHPALGAFPVVVQGDVRASLAAAAAAAAAANSNKKKKTTTESSGGGGGSGGGGNDARTSSPTTSPRPAVPATITLLNPFAAPRSSTADAAPDTDSKRGSPSPKPSSDSSRDRPASPAPDEVLARLALHTATLTVDVAAIAALGADEKNSSPHAHSPHPHVVDVAVAAVLAVLVAERRRVGVPTPVRDDASTTTGLLAGGGSAAAAVEAQQRQHQHQQQGVYGGGTWPAPVAAAAAGTVVFEGPPTAAARRWPGMEAVGPRELVREKVRLGSWGWWFGEDGEKAEAKARKREAKARKKGVVDIEMGQVGAGERRVEGEGKGKEKEEGMHWLVELVLMLLVFAFKVVWFLLTILFKVLGRVVGVVNRCAAKA
ncbi:acetylserotonin methytransferase-like protein [Diplodia corticola]|uniref:Acetylserotonin methytransferase-like protein n=1 Tax=Diplodia corticola TaxID=236234 RepID=A0A1J9RFH5_9PEZI|nr:acetylserotonin methytransferase-like protein [Diplodia corticola]OJD40286.1 acetylserotonin methytransferase-like protein [Diplodia corticola]